LHNNVTLTDVVCEQLASAARLNVDDLQLGSHSIRLSIQPQYLEDLANDGTRVHTNSWGSAVNGEYTQSAALVKATLINGAHNIIGQYVPSESGRIPNFAEGFGRVDLAATVTEAIVFKDEATELDTGEEETTIVTVSSPNSTLKVTLVWTDPPGEALQNDLDLIVRGVDGRERHGNMRGTSSKFDRFNNVEQVIWPNIPIGDVTILVRAYRAIQTQSYALVVRIS
jgi:serine protease AprX